MTDQLNLIDTIAKAERFSTVTKLLRAVKADGWAMGDTEFTVFAPTNEAFAKIPEATLNELMTPGKSADLKALISYHIVPGKHMATNLASAGSARSVSGQELSFGETNGLKVNGVSIGARNIEASNGVVHAIDTVLTPPAASSVGTDPRGDVLAAAAGKPSA
jgi:uncharacterized surface protein with fasciclin (FAS1) repeats